MAKKIKDQWLGARVDRDLAGLVDGYIDAAEISMGDLVRRSVKEYMENHPIEPIKPSKIKEK